MRVYQCDYCRGLIEWKDGTKGGDPPPITVRGQGLVLDFCSVGCMGEWGTERADEEDEPISEALKKSGPITNKEK